MVGAREGQKRDRKERIQALISVEDGGTNEEIHGYVDCCSVLSVTFIENIRMTQRRRVLRGEEGEIDITGNSIIIMKLFNTDIKHITQLKFYVAKLNKKYSES